jgi:hypothetical protein
MPTGSPDSGVPSHVAGSEAVVLVASDVVVLVCETNTLVVVASDVVVLVGSGTDPTEV